MGRRGSGWRLSALRCGLAYAGQLPMSSTFPVSLEAVDAASVENPCRTMFWAAEYDKNDPFASMIKLLARATVEEYQPVRFWIDRTFRGWLDIASLRDPNVITIASDESKPFEESYNGVPVEIVEG
jgi:hypothetical protein